MSTQQNLAGGQTKYIMTHKIIFSRLCNPHQMFIMDEHIILFTAKILQNETTALYHHPIAVSNYGISYKQQHNRQR